MTKMRQWTIITAVAVLGVFAAGWFLMIKPQKSKAADLHTQTDSQAAANQRLLAEIATLQSEEKNLPQQQAALRKFTTQVPDTAAEPTIIRQLSTAANGSGVDLVSMTPGAPAAVAATTTAPATGTAATGSSTVPGSTSLTTTPTGGSLMQLPISIGITGTYPNVESFFQSLETLPRAMLVTGWSLCPIGGEGAPTPSGGTGGANCTAPTVPQGKELPPNSLGGTLSAVIFYSPPAGTTSGTGVSTLPATGTTTTTTSTTTTPTTTTGTPAPSTAVTPATTGATTAPAN
jgi:Tfp pilus assembly protein PilO